MFRKIIVILPLIFILQITFGQSITWQRTYDGPGANSDGAYSICKADTNNFYIVGYSFTGFRKIYVLKINQFGDTLWTRLIGDPNEGGPRGLASVSSGDGGCVLTGDWDSAFTIKLNSSGDLIWLKKYAGGTSPQLYDIKKTPDGGYIACGIERTNNFNGCVLKIDSLGNLQWLRIYPASFEKALLSIENEDVNKYIICGRRLLNSQDSSKGMILKIDSLGNVIWEKIFSIKSITDARRITKINSGYLIGGDALPWGMIDSTRIYYRKIDTAGNEISTKIFSSSRKEIFGALGVYNNRYTIASSVDSFPLILIGKIRITDTSGNIIRERNVFTPDYIVFSSLTSLSNGDIILAGEADFNTSIFNDIYALRTDSLLSISPLFGIEIIGSQIPSDFKLYPNYPNPFNPQTKIRFDIPQSSDVSISIYDILGREVYKISEFKQAGSYEFKFEGSNLATGMYFYKLTAGTFTETKKMVLVK